VLGFHHGLDRGIGDGGVELAPGFGERGLEARHVAVGGGEDLDLLEARCRCRRHAVLQPFASFVEHVF